MTFLSTYMCRGSGKGCSNTQCSLLQTMKLYNIYPGQKGRFLCNVKQRFCLMYDSKLWTTLHFFYKEQLIKTLKSCCFMLYVCVYVIILGEV